MEKPPFPLKSWLWACVTSQGKEEHTFLTWCHFSAEYFNRGRQTVK